MTEFSYSEAKNFLEEKIEELSQKYNIKALPYFNIKKDQFSLSILFDTSKHADKYKLISIFLENIGNMTAECLNGNISLSYETGTISFSDVGRFHTVLFYKNRLNGEAKFSIDELNAVIEAYKHGNLLTSNSSTKKLPDYGIIIYDSDEEITWDYLAGYEDIKEEIRDTVLLPLKHPEIYDEIIKGTRKKFESIRPKAVLFEGPPGTGKTTTARIIASEAGVPLVYVPIESIMTKWYGESERNLAAIFDACSEFENSILFLDEIDSLATSRDSNMHEATRRVLSVLLRKIDGLESSTENTILIGSTNRKQDLDPALLSRFDVSVHFRLPNLEERALIFENYAKHLSYDDRIILAKESEGFSGRNIKDLCEYCERSWASKLLRNEVSENLPPLDEYLNSLQKRKDFFSE